MMANPFWLSMISRCCHISRCGFSSKIDLCFYWWKPSSSSFIGILLLLLLPELRLDLGINILRAHKISLHKRRIASWELRGRVYTDYYHLSNWIPRWPTPLLGPWAPICRIILLNLMSGPVETRLRPICSKKSSTMTLLCSNVCELIKLTVTSSQCAQHPSRL